jgi:hypothetical protein
MVDTNKNINDNAGNKQSENPMLLKRFAKKVKNDNTFPGFINPNHIPDPHLSSSSSDALSNNIGFIKNIVRHFNPDRAVLVVRHNKQDLNIVADFKTEILVGKQKGDFDDLTINQTIDFQIDSHNTAFLIQINAGVFEGKVQKIIKDGGDTVILVEDDSKKKTLSIS